MICILMLHGRLAELRNPPQPGQPITHPIDEQTSETAAMG